MSPVMWVREEAGWYTSTLGGICQEGDGRWHFYPRDSSPHDLAYPTCKQAMRAAERRAVNV